MEPNDLVWVAPLQRVFVLNAVCWVSALACVCHPSRGSQDLRMKITRLDTVSKTTKKSNLMHNDNLTWLDSINGFNLMPIPINIWSHNKNYELRRKMVVYHRIITHLQSHLFTDLQLMTQCGHYGSSVFKCTHLSNEKKKEPISTSYST